MKSLLLIPALLWPLSVTVADTAYRIVHPDGTVEFTDDPHRGGVPIELEPAPSVPALVAPPPPPARAPAPEADKPAAFTGYQRLGILSPEADQVIWFDGTGVTVNLAIQPPLQTGHRIVIEMNGEPVAGGQGRSFTIATVHPGTHQLRAHVLDQQGQRHISSDAVTFHFRRHTVRPDQNNAQ